MAGAFTPMGSGTNRRGKKGGGRLVRLLGILAQIHAKEGPTARDLAERFEVTERTVYRDLEALGEAGFTIYNDKGYRVMRETPLPPIQLSIPEAIALTVAGWALREQEGVHYGTAVKGALDKLGAILPAEIRRLSEEARARIKIDLQAFELHLDLLDRMPILEQALLERRRCRITYFSFHSGETLDRTVDPYSLLFRERAWYLVAHCHLRNQVKLFRVDRIKKLQVLDETFEFPAGFSLDEYMKNAWEIERGEEVTVKIRFTPRIAPLIREAKWHESQEIAEEPGGSVLMTVTTGGRHELVRWLAGFGGDARVVEPDDLRRELVRVAAAAARVNGAR